MKRALVVGTMLVTLAVIVAAGAEPKATSKGKVKDGDVIWEEPTAVKMFENLEMRVVTNAKGEVVEAKVSTAGFATYPVLTNKMSKTALADLAKLNGKTVDAKGEIVQVNTQLVFKVVGQFKINAAVEEAKKEAAEREKAAQKKVAKDAAKKKAK